MRRRIREQVESTADLRCFDDTGLGDAQVWDAFTSWCATRRAYEHETGLPGGGLRRLLAEAHVRLELRHSRAALPEDLSP